jgi:hypothetical protein
MLRPEDRPRVYLVAVILPLGILLLIPRPARGTANKHTPALLA